MGTRYWERVLAPFTGLYYNVKLQYLPPLSTSCWPATPVGYQWWRLELQDSHTSQWMTAHPHPGSWCAHRYLSPYLWRVGTFLQDQILSTPTLLWVLCYETNKKENRKMKWHTRQEGVVLVCDREFCKELSTQSFFLNKESKLLTDLI